MRQTTYTVVSDYDGVRLSVLEVAPEGAPRAIVQLTHGICEFKERYLPVMKYFAGRGCLCVLHDHRGHGASVAKKEDLGYFEAGGADAIVEDMHQITKRLRRNYPGVPLILLGHSMGSLAARAYADRYDGEIDGLILTGSPARRGGMAASLCLLKLLTLLRGERYRSRLMWGIVTHTLGRHAVDPAAEGGLDKSCIFTLNGDIALTKLMGRAYGIKPPRAKAALPIFLYSGDNDRYAPKPEQFTEAMERLRRGGFTNVNGHVFPGLHHDVLTVDGSPEVYDLILEEAIEPLMIG